MRLFVALEVPESPRREAESRVRRLRRELPPARWVDLSSIHLTLAFFGAVDDPQLGALAAALAAPCARCRPLTVRLAGAGTFPPRRPARVAWLDVDAGAAAPELAALRADLVAAAAALPGIRFEPEERAFHPHVTLARCPEPWPRSAAETFVAAFAEPLGEPFTVARAVLLESRLGSRGAHYREAASLPFEGAAA